MGSYVTHTYIYMIYTLQTNETLHSYALRSHLGQKYLNACTHAAWLAGLGTHFRLNIHQIVIRNVNFDKYIYNNSRGVIFAKKLNMGRQLDTRGL
jgi:hypothetical protein